MEYGQVKKWDRIRPKLAGNLPAMRVMNPAGYTTGNSLELVTPVGFS